MSSSLPSGTYTITSHATNNPIGRPLVEDRSALPKRVVMLSGGTEAPKWDIESHGETYIMKTRGGTVASIDGNVVAVLIDEPDMKDRWLITRSEHPKDGPNAYIVELADRSSGGWYMPDTAPETQVGIRPLIAGLSYPPFYPSPQLFDFTPIEASCAALGVLALAGTSMAASMAEWQSRTIYQLVTDRFAKTTDDGGPCDSGARQYCGGTWQGIINHLDYIQGMGFDAIWISPVVANIEGNTTYGEAYHGYWTQDFNALNSHFGAASDLQALATAVHSRGMYLMFDLVLNHVAYALPTNTTNLSTFGPSLAGNYTPYNTAAEYHNFCFITDYNNQTDVEQCWLGDTNVALPDLNTEDPDVVNGHVSWVSNLIKTYGVDGIRLDTVKHIHQSFYPGFLSGIGGLYSLGEVLDGFANYTGPYTNYVDAVFNYPQYYVLTSTFANPQGSMANLVQSFKDTQTYFKGGAMSTGAFSENQDNPRLPNFIADPTQIQNIIAWTYAGDGIPITYYGQEAGYTGGNDPDNREALWFTSYSNQVVNYKFITYLNMARRMAMKANTAFTTTNATIVGSSDSVIAMSKFPLLTVLTNAGNSSGVTHFTIPSGSGHKNGETLVDILSTGCDTTVVANDGSLLVNFTAGQPKVYLPTTALNSTGPCGNLAVAGSSASGAIPTSRTYNGVILAVAGAIVGCFALL
ncbi:hypothetical protein FRB96_003235 [Tulasnella sp. 330]|nr:hypothetical protein FRB96_003235 [Tulasnella sp. 330]